jgi:SAM-dependent methyltransferase
MIQGSIREQMSCRWCGGHAVIGDGPSSKPDWSRYKCQCCGTIDYLTLPDQITLSEVYQSAWGASHSHGIFAAGSTNESISTSLLDAVGWHDVVGVSMDYGAGKGYLSRAMANRGGKVLAIEPYGGAVDREISSPVLWHKSLDDIPGELKFEWIFLVEVIEHMLDPVNELSSLRERLVPGGKLVITTPNARGWRAKKDGFKWREAQNPTHITLFTEASLKSCMNTAGFSKILRVRKPVDYGKKGLAQFALAISQLLGVDGGLRFIASE